MLIRLSKPSGLFVSVVDVKAQAVISTSDDNTLLEGYIRSATALAAKRTGRILQPAEFEWRTGSWCEPICVPAHPLRSVTEIAYLDEDNVEQVLDPGEWYQVETSSGFEIRFTDSFSSPSVSDRLDLPVRVRFSAGYDNPDASGSGDDPALAQDAIDRLLVTILAAHWYQNREPVSDTATNKVPFSAETLIEVRRIFR